jgi:putative ABC transport system ATP-binding protein
VDQSNKDEDVSKLRRDKIGIVFQTFNLLALMSAYENIELPMRIKGELS